MSDSIYEKRTPLPVGREEAFAWHDRPGAFERLTPPFEPVTLVEQTGGIRDGARVVIRIKNGPVSIRWHARHEGYDPPRKFVDVQTKGPFARWRHEHLFEEGDSGNAVMHDRVTYAPPLGALGSAVGGGLIRKKLDRMFAYRHDTLCADLTDHALFHETPRNTFVISGASGLVGTQLCAFLTTGGHTVRRLVRDATRANPDEGRYHWSPDDGTIDTSVFDGADVVIHLAGESVFGVRWTESKKRRILESRERGTTLIARSMAQHAGPRVLVSASAVGYYGNHPEGTVDESGGNGEGFLAEVCKRWEAPTQIAEDAGVRVALARIGVVLSPKGGALKVMLPAFKLGLGGPIGSGRQPFPWVSIDDTIRALHWCAMRDDIRGPVNVVSPGCIRQREFAKTLASTLRRPAILPAPAPMLKLLAGEMAREVLLKGAHVEPSILASSGFRFRDDRAPAALARLLGRPLR